MPTATFQADISGFTKAMQQGIVSANAFNKATAESISQVKKQVDSLSGVRLVSEAQKMAEAVRRLGGDSGYAAGLLKLLPSELERVRAAMDQATQKAKLMGVALPDALKGINAELAKMPATTTNAAGGLSSLVGAFTKLGPLIGVTSFVGAATTIGRIGFAAVESADALLDLSAKTGLSTDALQEMQAVAAETGTDVDTFAKAATTLGVNLANGTTKAKDAIDDLGLSFTELARLQPEEQFNRIIKALEEEENVGRRNAAGRALFGKQWDEIAAGVVQGYSDIAGAASKSSREQLEALGRAADAWDKFKRDVNTSVQSMLGNLILAVQAIEKAADSMTAFEKIKLFAEGGFTAGEYLKRLQEIGEQQIKNEEFAKQNAMVKSHGDAAKAAEDYVKQLAEIQARLGKLTPGQTAQLNAALKLGGDAAKEYAASIDLSEEALALYTSSAKDGTKATDAFADAVAKFKGVESFKAAEEAIKQIAAAGGPLKVVGSQLQALSTLFKKAAEDAISLGRVDLANKYAELAKELSPAVQLQKRLNVTIGEYVTDATMAASATDALADQVNRLTGNVTTLLPPLKSTLDVWKSMEGLKAPAIEVPSVGPISDSIGATMRTRLTDIFKDIPMTLARAFEGGGDWLGAFKSIGSQIGAALGAGLGGKLAENMTGKFAKAIPYIGEAIGSLLGPLIGKIGDALTRSAGEDVMRRVGKSWGVQISEALGDQIAETAKTLFKGDRLTAEVFHFEDIVKAAGGLNEVNFDKFIARFRDVFVLFGQGKLSLQQTQKVLNENFKHFADLVIKTGNIASKEFLELIRLNKQFGTESEAIADFVKEQAGRAGSALAGAFAGAIHPEEFQRLGVLALGAFNAAIDAGLSMQDALIAVGPALDKLVKGFADLGLEADEALKPLLVAHQVAQTTAGSAAAALNEAILALSNFGALNESTLDALEGQLATVFQRVQAEVAAVGGTHADALRQMLPFLEQAMRAAEEFGLELDPATRELIDQARELGLLGQKGETETDKMTKGFESVVDAVKELTEALTGIPRAARDAANAISQIKLPPIDRRRPDEGPGEWTPDGGGPIGPSQTAAIVASSVGHALTLAPVFVYGQAPASSIDAAITSHLPVALATGQPRAAVKALATFAAEEAIARAR